MRITVLLIPALVFILAACTPESGGEQKTSSPLAEQTESPTRADTIQLIRKTIEYRYGESVYHVTIDSESEMHWEAVAGDEKGVMEEETYKMHYLDPRTIFITWGEANGIGVSQVLKFDQGLVYNHLLRGRDVSISTGEIEILE